MISLFFSKQRLSILMYKRYSAFIMSNVKAKPLKKLTIKYITLPFTYITWHSIIKKHWVNYIDEECIRHIEDNYADEIQERASEMAEEYDTSRQECYDL